VVGVRRRLDWIGLFGDQVRAVKYSSVVALTGERLRFVLWMRRRGSY
jgi:hypothetical protein